MYEEIMFNTLVMFVNCGAVNKCYTFTLLMNITSYHCRRSDEEKKQLSAITSLCKEIWFWFPFNITWKSVWLYKITMKIQKTAPIINICHSGKTDTKVKMLKTIVMNFLSIVEYWAFVSLLKHCITKQRIIISYP